MAILSFLPYSIYEGCLKFRRTPGRLSGTPRARTRRTSPWSSGIPRRFDQQYHYYYYNQYYYYFCYYYHCYYYCYHIYIYIYIYIYIPLSLSIYLSISLSLYLSLSLYTYIFIYLSLSHTYIYIYIYKRFLRSSSKSRYSNWVSSSAMALTPSASDYYSSVNNLWLLLKLFYVFLSKLFLIFIF